MKADTSVPSGLTALAMVAGRYQMAADPAQLRHALGFDGKPVGIGEILLAAKQIGLKAKPAVARWERLSKLSGPAILSLDSGEFAVLARAEADRVLMLRPGEPRPTVLGKEGLESIWSGRLVLVKPRLDLTDPGRRFGFAWFLPVIRKFRVTLLEVLIAAFVVQLLGLATPLFSQVIIDKVLMHQSVSTLHVLAFGMAVVILFEGVLNVLQNHLLNHTANRVDVVLGGRLFSHLLRVPLRYFETRRVGDTVARVRELETIRQFLTGSSITAALDVLFIGIFLAVMLFYSISLTLVVAACLPLLIGLSLAIRPMLRQRLDERFDRGAEAQAFLIEAVSGAQTVKAMALEPAMHRKWEATLARYVTTSFRMADLTSAASASGQVIQRLADLTILWLGARLVMQGSLTVGQLIAFQMLSARVIAPVLRVVHLWQDFQQVALSVDRLGDLMNTQPEPALSPGKTGLPSLAGAVVLEGVSFRYCAEGPAVLRDLSFEVAPGSTIAIVGRSGSGKSTLAKLLERLYAPESGRILIDGMDLKQVDPAWLRRQIGVVLQDSFLFSGSLRENIAVQLPDAPMERIVEAARLAGAHEFILELPEGYDTQVGERGAALSGGQRQRVAIARALLADPRILIFDEATSALDYESERIIQNNLARIRHGRTVFLIAHRLSTIRQADTILVLDHGRLAEHGTHAELLARGGVYCHLFSQQEHAYASQVA